MRRLLPLMLVALLAGGGLLLAQLWWPSSSSTIARGGPARPAPRGAAGEPRGVVPAALASAPLGADGEPTGVVATVNGRPIEARRLFALVDRLAGDPARTPPAERQRQARALLDRLIDQELADQALAALKAEVSTKDIDDALLAQVKVNGHESLAALEAKMRREGATLEDARAPIRSRLVVRKLAEAQGRMHVTEAEVRAAYDRAPAEWGTPRSTVVDAWIARFPPPAPADEIERTRQAAEGFARAVQGGELVEQAANRHRLAPLPRFAVAPGSGEAGLEEAAAAIAIGSFSPPIRTRAGWVVVRPAERRAPVVRTFEDVREEVRQALVARRRQDEERRVLEDLRAHADIVDHLAP